MSARFQFDLVPLWIGGMAKPPHGPIDKARRPQAAEVGQDRDVAQFNRQPGQPLTPPHYMGQFFRARQPAGGHVLRLDF